VLVALTKVDEYDPALASKLEHITRSELISSLIFKLSHATGIPHHNVFPIKNFSTEYSPEQAPAVAPLLYLLLHNALVCSSTFLQEEAGLEPSQCCAAAADRSGSIGSGACGGGSSGNGGDDSQWRAHAVVVARPY
jgi:hypothetical protein